VTVVPSRPGRAQTRLRRGYAAPVTGLLNLVLDIPICLHARHHRIHCQILLRGFWAGLDAVEHGAQLRVQFGALLGDPAVLAFSAY